MESLLGMLFDRYERSEAMAVLQDATIREFATASLAPDLETAGMPPGMLMSSEGENLFIAVLSLRLKFSEDEAREKVALNIAMRERRSSS